MSLTTLAFLAAYGEADSSAASLSTKPPIAPKDVAYTKQFIKAHVAHDYKGRHAASESFFLVANRVVYAVGAPLAQGSYGTFHIGVDPLGKSWAVKKMMKRRSVEPGAAPCTEDEIRSEFGLVGYVLGDQVVVRHILEDDEATYAVMTLWDGNFSDLYSRSYEFKNGIRLMLRHVSRHGARLHAAGYIHNDIRGANILWNEDGQFALWDYGYAKPVDQDGKLERVAVELCRRLNCGARVNEFVSAPEVALGPYTDKADTWSLGLTVLESFSIEEDPGLFHGAYNELFFHGAAYAQWYDAMAAASPSGLSCALIAHPDTVSISTRHWYFAAMYYELGRRDLPLCDLLLQKMLVPDPDKRWSLAEVAEHTDELWLHPRQRDALISTLRRIRADTTERAVQIQYLRSLMNYP